MRDQHFAMKVCIKASSWQLLLILGIDFLLDGVPNQYHCSLLVEQHRGVVFLRSRDHFLDFEYEPRWDAISEPSAALPILADLARLFAPFRRLLVQ